MHFDIQVALHRIIDYSITVYPEEESTINIVYALYQHPHHCNKSPITWYWMCNNDSDNNNDIKRDNNDYFFWSDHRPAVHWSAGSEASNAIRLDGCVPENIFKVAVFVWNWNFSNRFKAQKKHSTLGVMKLSHKVLLRKYYVIWQLQKALWHFALSVSLTIF